MNCIHRCDPYPSGTIVVSDEEFARHPLGNWTPPRVVPCTLCGVPMDRGRYSSTISIPELRRFP